jgi:Sigma-70, region 4
MQPSARSVETLRLVANGKTLAEAGDILGISRGRARQLLDQACRRLGVPDSVAEIHAQGPAYLNLLNLSTANPLAQLQPKIAANLLCVLGNRSADTVKPEHLSHISAAQLLDVGLTIVAVADIQEWMEKNHTSLRREPPNSTEHAKALRRAAFLLDAFGITKEQASSKSIANSETL